MYAEVLVEYGVKSLDKTFTYIIPDKLKNNLKIGMKVIVPFGTKNINGFVIAINESIETSIDLKEIIEISDENLILNAELLALGAHLKECTLCSLITAYQTMLPSSLKVKNIKTNYTKYDSYVVLAKEENEIIKYIRENGRRKKQVEILEALLIDHAILKSEIKSSSLDTLLAKGLVKIEKTQKYRLNYGYVENASKPILTDEQNIAITKINKFLYEAKTILLHGVTGSGKTEIYMRLIEKVCNDHKRALMLMPEISLTTQMIERFYERFGNKVAIYHSNLSEGEKYDEYLKILRGEVSIIIGTRSAIFTPITNLGIIIVDEEHSDNYKQENNPRYHVLDMAHFRSEYHKIPLVLGSATPSLESMARAKKNVYELITLENRIGSAVLPKITLVDMEPEMKKRNLIFSDLLKSKINDRLNKGEQIILLLNRRGFSTTITCSNCGFTYKCSNCDITLTYHKTNNNLRCHYCGYTKFKPEKCPECKSDSLNYFGLGTEKLEAEIKKEFINAKVVRMDADTTKNKGSHAKILTDFKEEKYNILLGTQMISKGLDFPKVTLVGIINADTSLNIPDFRSSERTFQLLSQTAGRAGRKDIPGEVIIQTFNPDNYTLNYVKENNYEHFFNYEMNLRKKMKYSPYYYLVNIKVASKDYDLASGEVKKVNNYLRNNLNSETIILGPTTANIFKVNNIYRFNITLKYKSDLKLKKILKDLDNMYATNSKTFIDIDINPIHI